MTETATLEQLTAEEVVSLAEKVNVTDWFPWGPKLPARSYWGSVDGIKVSIDADAKCIIAYSDNGFRLGECSLAVRNALFNRIVRVYDNIMDTMARSVLSTDHDRDYEIKRSIEKARALLAS